MRLIESCLVGTFMLVTTGADAGEAPSWKLDLPANIARIHAESDWTRVTPSDLSRILGVRMTPEHQDASSEATNCSGAVIYQSETAPGSLNVIVAWFDRQNRKESCRSILRRVSFVITAPMRDAEPMRGRVLNVLKPGGRPEGDGIRVKFIWRSLDSRWQYDLFISVEPQTEPATPESPGLLRIMLDHTSVLPDEVDDLPFEKGYFPPVCEGVEK